MATQLRPERANGRATEHEAPAPHAPSAPSLLDQILDHQSAVDLGRKLVPTGYLPDHIKTPEQAMAIILAGQEMGMRPMRALRSLVLVKGKVTENADSQLARFKADGGRAKWLLLTEEEAKLWLRHPNGDEHTETFTMADAERAGLTRPSRNGEPSMFTKFPKAMLRSRAITAGLKSVGWEGGVGAYDPDELVHVPPSEEPETTSRAAAPARSGTSTANSGNASSTEAAERMTVADAMAYPFPFQKGKPVNGRPLGELKDDLLTSVADWIREKQAERGEDTFHVDTLTAIRIVLAEHQKDQTKLDLGEPAAADDAAANETSQPDPADVPSHEVVFPSTTKYPGITGKKLGEISTSVLQEVQAYVVEQGHESLALAIGDVLEARKQDTDLPF